MALLPLSMEAPPTKSTRRRVAALLGVYLAGWVVNGVVVVALQLKVTNPLPRFHVDINDTTLLTANTTSRPLHLNRVGGQPGRSHQNG